MEQSICQERHPIAQVKNGMVLPWHNVLPVLGTRGKDLETTLIGEENSGSSKIGVRCVRYARLSLRLGTILQKTDDIWGGFRCSVIIFQSTRVWHL